MSLDRTFWQSIETIHASVYFAPEAHTAYAEIGLKGYWRGYFASRASCLGTPSAGVVIAAFHGFAPSMVERAIPDVWQRADTAAIQAARRSVARAALGRVVSENSLGDLPKTLHGMLKDIDWAGKPLAAAHAWLPVPEEPIDLLWHAATALREYRGDCHLAILTAAGLDGVTANALSVVTGRSSRDAQLRDRGWTEEQWAEGLERLRRRAWVDEFAMITDSGTAARNQLEDATDRVCAAGLNEEAKARAVIVQSKLVKIAQDLIDSKALPHSPLATK